MWRSLLTDEENILSSNQQLHELILIFRIVCTKVAMKSAMPLHYVLGA